MASIFEQYGIKEVADVTFYERDTAGHEKPVLYIDTAKVSTIEKTASTAEARGGKGNPALISWDFGLEINVTLEDALFSPQSMAIMQGSGKAIEGTSTNPVSWFTNNFMRVKFRGKARSYTTIDDTDGDIAVYRCSTEPSALYQTNINAGDIWIHTNNSSRLYIFIPQEEIDQYGIIPNYEADEIYAHGGWVIAWAWWQRSPGAGAGHDACFLTVSDYGSAAVHISPNSSYGIVPSFSM